MCGATIHSPVDSGRKQITLENMRLSDMIVFDGVMSPEQIASNQRQLEAISKNGGRVGKKKKKGSKKKPSIKQQGPQPLSEMTNDHLSNLLRQYETKWPDKTHRIEQIRMEIEVRVEKLAKSLGN